MHKGLIWPRSLPAPVLHANPGWFMQYWPSIHIAWQVGWEVCAICTLHNTHSGLLITDSVAPVSTCTSILMSALLTHTTTCNALGAGETEDAQYIVYSDWVCSSVYSVLSSWIECFLSSYKIASVRDSDHVPSCSILWRCGSARHSSYILESAACGGMVSSTTKIWRWVVLWLSRLLLKFTRCRGHLECQRRTFYLLCSLFS